MRYGIGLTISIMLALGVVVVAPIITSHEPAKLGPAQSVTMEESDMIALTNAYREANGLSDLLVNSKLMQSAQDKANTLCRTGDWSHNAGGERFYKAIDRTGYDYTEAGENLAKGFKTTKAAFKALVNSPTHLANIVGNYKDIGVGFNECGGLDYYVIHYGRIEK